MAFRNRIVRLSQLIADSITGALIRTAASGKRWELTSADVVTLYAYSGLTEETAPGGITVEQNGAVVPRTSSLYLRGPTLDNNVTPPQLRLASSSKVAGWGNSQVQLMSGENANGGEAHARLTSGPTGAGGEAQGLYLGHQLHGDPAEHPLDVYNGGVRTPLENTGWVNVGAVGAPAFKNGWVNNGAPAVPTRYCRVNGVTYVQVAVKSGASGPIFTLPAGFRPASTIVNPAADGSNLSQGRVDVTGAGDVWVVNGNNAFIGMSVAFPAEA